MKNLTLIDNVWKERKNPNITDEERAILDNKHVNNNELRKTTLDNIRNRSFENASDEDATIAQNLYDSHKLQNAIVITVDISLPTGHGIINCRVNNEHKQIRF